MNGFNDLFSQFRFLQVPTFSDWSKVRLSLTSR